MNPQETQQVIARDEKWVPSTERVKISSTNAFTITTEVPKIFMQQFWYTIKKVKDSESYEFLLANKKCIVDAEVFRKILDISPRVEFVPEPARRRPSGIAFRDTSRVSKKVSSDPSQKLKVVQSLTPKEQEVVDTMQALKESKKTSRRQPSIGGSSEGTGRIPRVPDESTIVSATSSEGTGTILWVPYEEKVTSEENVILELGSEQESEYSEEDQGDDEKVDWIDSDEDEEKKDDTDDDKSIDLEMTDDEETEYEFVQGDEQVNDDEDEEMTNAEVEKSGNGDAEISNAAKADVGKTEEVKDGAKKAELPPTSSSSSVSSGFGDQFLKLSSDTSLVSTVKDTTDAEINSLLDIKIQSEFPYIQSTSVLRVPVSVISEPSILSPTQETPLVAPVITLPLPSVSTISPVPHKTIAPIPALPITTDAPTITTVVPESDALTAVHLRVAKLEKDVSELKKIDHTIEALATLKHTANLIQKYFVKPAPESSKIQKPTIDLEQESKKSASEIHKIKREQAEKQKMSKYTIKSTDKAELKEYDQKSALYQTMHENKSFNRNPANHALYHALMEALIEDENAMDKGVVDTVKNHKRQHDDDDDDDYEDLSAGPNQGKKTKRRRTKESESSKKPSTTKETSKCKASSKSSKLTLNQDWFKQPPDPEWNKRQVVLDQPEQPWFNQMVSATKDPLTFNDLMATPINFSKSQVNKFSKHNVYSTQKILGVNSVSVKKPHGYGHLEEIVLFHLNESDIVDFIVALRMFTRSLIIKRRVEDLQLGVERYQKKLNITAPQKTFPEIEFKEL
ncbi:hypothetical protein Tco_1266207 [Tanacetum coccineum]